MAAVEEDSPEYYTTGGLRNLGNTCFINCILQCLAHVPPLRAFLRSVAVPPSKPCDTLAALKQLFDEASRCTVFAPRQFCSVVRQLGAFVPGSQGDAQEFVLFVLQTCHEQLRQERVGNLRPTAR